jgi:dihydrofolate reductase
MILTLTQFVTLDGVSQGPGSATEDTSDGFQDGGWLIPHTDDVFVSTMSQWLDHADALLLGRRTYEAFARDWPQITDPDDPFTERMNGLPKFVVSRTIKRADWHPTTVLRGNAIEEVSALKARPGRELQIHGSARLGGALLGAGIVDLLRLVVAPTVLGRGRRLFATTGAPVGLRPMTHELTPRGLLLLEYEVTGGALVGEYAGVAAMSRTE